MQDRVLVTGGAGFVGSHLVELLLERGYRVRVLDNLSLGQRDWVNSEAELQEGDIRDIEACRKAAKECDGVFHAAAMSRSAASLDNVQICTSNNILGTENVLIAAREAGMKKVIYSGSSTYYGNSPPPHVETSPPSFLNLYGLTKHVGEEYCLMFDRMYNLPAVVLRYFQVYGPRSSGEGAYALVLSIFLKQRAEGQPLTIHGRGEQSRDFVHVRDVARANLMAYEAPVHDKVYNVGSGVTTSIKTIADYISKEQVFEPRRSADADITLADVSSIKKDLGWSAEIALDEGLRDLVERDLGVQHASR